ncbi:hypothetical protein M911_01595 [Ectothiorhodospira haloalkaliphila]|uniref:Resolvase HTH domain-containing protein n=1 Tax=Ectothiorhodospira haloalkaliphila TaxID=421628 RepID=W8KG40_9GAMM|nr:helix-turn-helix domain-containing protein [Ectothiorhodospira haloalkaliphila]AHK78108.1 hypothetical protein M911_01595 [Ectothiorhodospira haloalkaliphila]
MDFLADLKKQITRHLPDRPDASQVASAIVSSIRSRWAGEKIYLRQVNERRQHALALIRQGATVKEAADQVEVHVSTVYRWISETRRRNLESPRPRRGLERTDTWL